jgi:hypothetical protein
MDVERLTSETRDSLRYGRDGVQDLETWKHFAAFGGEDKNRMVTVASWLLGLSSAVLWHTLVELMSGNAMALNEPQRAAMVSALGGGLSFIAGFVVLLYGGYSNHNWQLADEIAKARGWGDLLPSHHLTGPTKGIVNRTALFLARPCEPLRQQAPIFWLFLIVSVMMFAFHATLLIWALASI